MKIQLEILLLLVLAAVLVAVPVSAFSLGAPLPPGIPVSTPTPTPTATIDKIQVHGPYYGVPVDLTYTRQDYHDFYNATADPIIGYNYVIFPTSYTAYADDTTYTVTTSDFTIAVKKFAKQGLAYDPAVTKVVDDPDTMVHTIAQGPMSDLSINVTNGKVPAWYGAWVLENY